MSEGYKNTLKNGKELYIPNWPVDVALVNLTMAGKYLGTDNVILISEINIPAVIVAIMGSDEPKKAAELIKHFVCQARVDGNKIDNNNIDSLFENDLSSVTEIFAHVIHAQYADFFNLGLAKEPSQEK